MNQVNKKTQNAVSPTREEDYPEWYQQVIKVAELAEASPVRGCMVIKPWGYAIWENMQKILDRMFKETGHENAYFPLLIPLSFFQQEAEHVAGFAKECAVVTHHRLIEGADGKLVPAGELEEPYIIRPTSETIIGHQYSKWVQSYRDLPILINQWANVMRWEMRTRMFLRTSEFLWQEGHTVHATAEEAMQETRKMLDVYATFAEETMAMPVIKGIKTPEEKFPGADTTYCIEAGMQDRKALQAGTSHFLGQNFAKASNIKFLNEQGVETIAWTTSWGVSTRLIGGLIMTHSDDDGLVLPPKLAPKQIVINPIIHKDEERQVVMAFCENLHSQLSKQTYAGEALRVTIDKRDLRGGEKNWHWIKKGVPLRVEVGPRDIAKASCFVGRRDKTPQDKTSFSVEDFIKQAPQLLGEIQTNLYQRAKELQKAHLTEINSFEDFKSYFTPKDEQKPEIHGGFALCHFALGNPEVTRIIKELKVTARCMPLELEDKPGKCIFTGLATTKRAYFAKSY